MPDFRQSILEAMKARKLHRTDLARLTFLDYNGITKYLRGDTDMLGGNISKLMDVLGIEVK